MLLLRGMVVQRGHAVFCAAPNPYPFFPRIILEPLAQGLNLGVIYVRADPLAGRGQPAASPARWVLQESIRRMEAALMLGAQGARPRCPASFAEAHWMESPHRRRPGLRQRERAAHVHVLAHVGGA